MKDIDDLNLKNILEHAHIGIVIHRWDTSVAYANPKALELLRLNYEQIIGKSAFDPQWHFIDDGGKQLLIEDYPVNKVIRTKQKLVNEVMGVVDGSRKEISWFLINAYFEGDGNSTSFVIVTFSDISDVKKLFSFEDIVENTQDIVIVTEAENVEYPTGPKIVYVNSAFESLTGYSSAEVVGETPRILQGTLTDKSATQRIHESLKKRQAVSETLLNYDKNGRPYWIQLNIIPLVNKYGEVTHFAAIERDVSESMFRQEQLEKRNQDLKVLKQNLENMVAERTLQLQEAKAQLEKIAFFDPLTNVPNRRFFIEQVKRLISSVQRRGGNLVLGILDIDNFKHVNDTHGHDVGDEVLVGLSNALQVEFRADDAFCRYGGEEFAFAFCVENQSDAAVLAERLLETSRQLVFECNAEGFEVTISIGLKFAQANTIADLESELKDADVALYEAKHNGKNQYVLHAS